MAIINFYPNKFKYPQIINPKILSGDIIFKSKYRYYGDKLYGN